MARLATEPDLYPVGERPPLGVVPALMHGWLVRPDRYGDPRSAFQAEVIETPEPGEGEVLVCVMAAGINYNGLWACQARPLDVTVRDTLAWHATRPADRQAALRSGFTPEQEAAILQDWHARKS